MTHNTTQQVIIYAIVSNHGVQKTGRYVRVDGEYRPELTSCLIAQACVWSRHSADLASGKEYAEREGGYCFALPDTDDVLAIAKAKAIELHKASRQ